MNEQQLNVARRSNGIDGKSQLLSLKMDHVESSLELFKSQNSLNAEINKLVDSNTNIQANAKVLSVVKKTINEIESFKTDLMLERQKIRKSLYKSQKQLLEPRRIFGKRVNAACILSKKAFSIASSVKKGLPVRV